MSTTTRASWYLLALCALLPGAASAQTTDEMNIAMAALQHYQARLEGMRVNLKPVAIDTSRASEVRVGRQPPAGILAWVAAELDAPVGRAECQPHTVRHMVRQLCRVPNARSVMTIRSMMVRGDTATVTVRAVHPTVGFSHPPEEPWLSAERGDYITLARQGNRWVVVAFRPGFIGH